MAYGTYAPALTAIREVLDDGHGSLRPISSARLGDRLTEGLSEEELQRRGIITAKPFRVRITGQRRHPASPPVIGNINLLAFDVEVTVSRTVALPQQVNSDVMATLEALAWEDSDAIRQALTTPPNLATTVAGTATNICGDCMRYIGTNRPRLVTQSPPAKAQRYETVHRFEAVLKITQATV